MTSIAPRDKSRVPQGVIVDELTDGIDLDGGATKKLKYPVPNMDEHDIEEYLSFEELELIAGDIDDVEYDNLSDENKQRYDKFVEAWYKKLDTVPQEQQ